MSNVFSCEFTVPSIMTNSVFSFFAPFVLTLADDLHKHPKETLSETISIHRDFPKNHLKDPHRSISSKR